MTAFNVARFLVKPGCDQDFRDSHRTMNRELAGGEGFNIIKTDERSYRIIGEWRDMADIVAERSAMIGNLGQFRDMFEGLGGGLDVTDPASGPVVQNLK